LISSSANTARCLGVPNATGVPATVINNGPKRPNPRRLPPIALPTLQVIGHVRLLLCRHRADDHETASGIDNYGMMSADFGIVDWISKMNS
jgi:hypothetical protein